MKEKILAIDRKSIFDPGFFLGFLPEQYCIPYLKQIERLTITTNRDEVEKNVNLKQLISYAIILAPEKIFAYQRVFGNEKRLKDLWSIGVGGHIKSRDHKSPLKAIENGTKRELKEEFSFLTKNINFLGLLNLEDNEVDKVHLGIVYSCLAKTELNGGKFLTPTEIFNLNLENWSRVLLESLLKHSLI